MKQKSLICEFYYPRPMTLMFENCPSIEKKFDNIFGGLSGRQIELFYRKKGAEKSRDTVPLRQVFKPDVGNLASPSLYF